MYVSHLSFTDDIIIFKNGSISSLQLLMALLHHYKVVSGQLISQPKSSFYVRFKCNSFNVDTIAFRVMSNLRLASSTFSFKPS